MSTPGNAGPVSPAEPQTIVPPVSPTRPFYWSVRRELWENRAVYIAPAAVAGAVLFGFLVSTFTLPRRMLAALSLDPAKQHAAITTPYNVIAGLVFATSFIVGVFYCLEALQGERRDRSILFWKSLPVSDRTTVLSKAAVPLLVLPLLSFALIVISQWIMLLLSTVVLLGRPGVAELWANVMFPQMVVAILYSMIAITLWHAPVYAWLLLISGWARRAAFLWAVLPPVLTAVLERIMFNNTHFTSLMYYRLIGWYMKAFDHEVEGKASLDPLMSLAPGAFLSTPGLWVGLGIAAALLAGAVRLRRNREPG